MTKLPYIRAEIASTHKQQERGLMYRKTMAKNSGMLFDFREDLPLAFWMKNTYLPLQIAFISNQGKILQIESMAPLSTKRIYSKKECRYALEVNDGWFDENGIKVGNYVSHPSGKWPETENSYGFKLKSQVMVPNPAGISPMMDPNTSGRTQRLRQKFLPCKY
jgi:uncharacterized membrane protein (UPF0127 family)